MWRVLLALSVVCLVVAVHAAIHYDWADAVLFLIITLACFTIARHSHDHHQL